MEGDAEKKYTTHDFSADQKWQSYLNNLYPMPPMNKMDKFKRKWFKQNVDSNLSLEPPVAPQAAPRPSAQSYSTGSASYSAPPSSTPTAPPKLASLANLQVALYLLMILCGFLYLIPLLGMESAQSFYRRMILCAMAASAVNLVSQFGMPKFSQDYLRVILMDDSAHFLFYCLVFYSSQPISAAMAPLVITALINMADQLKAVLPVFAPAIYSKLSGRIQQVIANRMLLLQYRGLIEVVLAFVLIVFSFTPAGSFLTAMMYLQFVRLRYMISAFTRSACHDVGAKIDGWLAYPMVPGLLRTGWNKIKSLLAGFVNTDQQASQRPSCTIM